MSPPETPAPPASQPPASQPPAGQPPAGLPPDGPVQPAAAESSYPRVRELVEALVIAIVFALFVRTFVVQAFKIPSGSMEENLLVGDHILVNKFIYGPRASALEEWVLPVRDPRRGDVVVFKYPDDPGRDFIKRCVATPGDEVEIIDKGLRVNGEAVVEEGYKQHTDDRIYSRSSYLLPGHRRRDNFGPYLVPPDNYFCLGDNRDNSRDSRFWTRTTVPREYLKGRAVMVYWSLEPGVRPVTGNVFERVGQRLSGTASRLRTERHFHQVR